MEWLILALIVGAIVGPAINSWSEGRLRESYERMFDPEVQRQEQERALRRERISRPLTRLWTSALVLFWVAFAAWFILRSS